jgi:hypothetical protein
MLKRLGLTQKALSYKQLKNVPKQSSNESYILAYEMSRFYCMFFWLCHILV